MIGEIDAGFVPARSPAVYTVEIDGEAVLLDEDERRLHHLNATAALVWQCIDGIASVAELAVEISDELDVPYSEVLHDTLGIVHHFGAELLLAGSQP